MSNRHSSKLYSIVTIVMDFIPGSLDLAIHKLIEPPFFNPIMKALIRKGRLYGIPFGILQNTHKVTNLLLPEIPPTYTALRHHQSMQIPAAKFRRKFCNLDFVLFSFGADGSRGAFIAFEILQQIEIGKIQKIVFLGGGSRRDVLGVEGTGFLAEDLGGAAVVVFDCLEQVGDVFEAEVVVLLVGGGVVGLFVEDLGREDWDLRDLVHWLNVFLRWVLLFTFLIEPVDIK